ncbi:MAG: hypothetical protein GKR91_03480 [Pseudomonadales bacterium]|nr:hypothetical protein [Pseudomonadales bacterium]
MTNENDPDNLENTKFTDDVKEALEFNKKKRKPTNGGEKPQPNLGKLEGLLKKKSEQNQEEENNGEGSNGNSSEPH